tara:strand:- start:158 stop:547 length:390 start_codon:yes stop_codon:yes gene_type:complete
MFENPWIQSALFFILGWIVRGGFERLFISGKLIILVRDAEKGCLKMLGRAEEHYWHSTKLLKEAASRTGKEEDMKIVLNSLKFTHDEWKKTAIESVAINHPFPSIIKWHDWQSAMRMIEQEKINRSMSK